MEAEKMLADLEDKLASSGGHCGESTSEMISRQRWEEKLATAIKVIKQYLGRK